MGDLLEIDEKKLVRAMRLLCELQELCCTKGRKRPKSLSKAVGLSVESMGSAADLLSCVGQSGANLRKGELVEHLTIFAETVVFSTAKALDLEDERSKAHQERNELVEKIRTKP